jgi:ABC-type molybdenum transport system ATPase subunit/photorepair protein PhrA
MQIMGGIKNYFYPVEAGHYKNFIKEQEKLLKDPSLSNESKTSIRANIISLKEASRKKDKNEALKQIGLGIVNSAGGLLGPVGAGVTALVTSSSRRPLPAKDIYKAKKCGGIRVVSKMRSRQRRDLRQNFVIDSQSVVEGVKVSFYSLCSPVSYLVSGLGFTAFSFYEYLKPTYD